jgi:IS5 family transposase
VSPGTNRADPDHRTTAPLGRPPKDVEKNRARRRQIREDEGVRNAVEGKFGQAKRRYGLERVMARLAESSLNVVSITFLVMNLDRLHAAPLLRLFEWLLLELDVIRNLFAWSSSRAAIELPLGDGLNSSANPI